MENSSQNDANTTENKPINYVLMDDVGVEGKESRAALDFTLDLKKNRITVDLPADFTLDKTITKSEITGLTGEKWVMDAAVILYLFAKEKGRL